MKKALNKIFNKIFNYISGKLYGSKKDIAPKETTWF
jgi:hypothetical protein